ncbi:MFS transporter [Thiococcus pfennigii]|uniref:MFS transporter n=1 Tax=Thiococcus pfennigii TaxID=1057 RepID=UPI001903552B|nr:MFS transporter [Thiococcus pfennigii]MBK1701009.1 MFS transporter [Thiococcus pfennigii]
MTATKRRAAAPAIPPLRPPELRAAVGLAGIVALRTLGLFLIMPVFAIYAGELAGATPLGIGLAIGAYGLTQALLQIPFGVLSDRIGRKPMIYAGLVLFALGSVLAALAESIELVIIGRAIQGSGAIAAVVMALTADLTREAVRVRAMAGIGVSVGLTFAISLVLAPTLAHWIGLSGLFWLTGAFAVAGMLILALVVPDPQRSVVHGDLEPVPGQLWGVLRQPDLLRLDLSAFLLHMVMTSLFLVLPLALVAAGLASAHHWQVYLPVVLVALASMVPLILFAERPGRAKPVLVGAVAALGATLLGLLFWHASLFALGAWLVVLFTLFHLLEAILPSLVAKRVPAGVKGTAMGVYTMFQFSGVFAGGLFGGWLYQAHGQDGVLLACAVAALLWLAIVASLRGPAGDAAAAAGAGPT